MAEKKLLQLDCTVEEIIYRNEANGYTVMTVMNNGATTTAVGMMAGVSIGDELKLIGNWKVHKSYGEQFAFDCYEQSIPSDETGILKYLMSGAVKGIGRATAVRIVEKFGAESLDVIKDDPERLATVRGISQEKAMALSEEINRTIGIRELMLKLSGYQISVQESVKIWKNFGSQAVEKIKENPYILCEESIGIDFSKADMIAIKLEKPLDDECRVRAGLVYVMLYNMRNGHTCLPKYTAIRAAAEFLKLAEEIVSETADNMVKDGSLIPYNMDEKKFLYLPVMYRSESYIAERLKVMLECPPESITGIEQALDNFEQQKNIRYADLQRKAIIQALSGGLLILTGGPGTGKTTTLNAIIDLYKQCGLKVMLAAPTGRAAQRMSEVTGRNAKTIHRLLEVEWDKNDMPAFKRNERNKLDCDALIIDELSMVDTVVFEGVVRALPEGCRLVMVGDSDQLPSVGAGNVLWELISSGKIPVVQLTEIFRQSMQSLIVTNAHKIVQGQMPDLVHRDNDFFFMPYSDREQILSTITELCGARLPKTYGYSPFEDIQVLCPSRKGDLGAVNMNIRLQAVLNPKADGVKEAVSENYTFRTGDKVMQIKNNYNLLWSRPDGTSGTGVFNGDVGRITSIDTHDKVVTVDFDDKTVEYTFETLNNLELAYAVTVHKSQGNEFNAVIIPVYGVPYQLCYRNLLYTGVTRAKKILILIGDVSVVKDMVENNKKTWRYSGLKSLLNENEE